MRGRAAVAERLAAEFARDVRAGLLAARKSIPSRWLWDEEGSRLFERICEVPEYYIPAAEREILAAHADEIAELAPRAASVFELGSGNAAKSRLVIEAMLRTRGRLGYVPVDISKAALDRTAARLGAEYTALDVEPLFGTYEDGVAHLAQPHERPRVILWLGSNVGNLDRREAASFLGSLRSAMREDDVLVVGIDLRKDRTTIERAYADSHGATARFNRNLLGRINRELGGHFELDRFRHRAVYFETQGVLEMHLVAEGAMRVPIDDLGIAVRIARGEAIHTEDCHKYSAAEIASFRRTAGLSLVRQWFDPQRLFSVNVFAP